MRLDLRWSGTAVLLVWCLAVVSAVAAPVTAQLRPPSVTNTKAFNPSTTASKVAAPMPAAAALLPPIVTKTFEPVVIRPGGTATMTFAVTNPNASDLSNVVFTDTMPSGLFITGFGNNVCSNWSLSLTNGGPDGYPDLSVGVNPLSANTTCTFSFPMFAKSAGDFYNTTSAVTSTEAGSGPPSNTALLQATDPIPTMSWLGLAALAAVLALAGIIAVRRRA
ncbi:MAG: DUF11 domain-containing protein [Acidobacteriia bacterium]|nr:DUF11 domain-containing protein [Terriglobia bacterium]